MCRNRAGLRLGPDGKKCVDIDECAEGKAPCEQECENRDPRDTGLQYVCKCRPGFSIDIDNQHKCILKVCACLLPSCPLLHACGLARFSNVTFFCLHVCAEMCMHAKMRSVCLLHQ